MSDDKFRSHIEWVFHWAIFLVNIPLTITALVLDTYHATSWGICHYNAKNYIEEKYDEGCRSGSGTTTNNTQTAECDIEHLDTLVFKSFVLIGGIVIP